MECCVTPAKTYSSSRMVNFIGPSLASVWRLHDETVRTMPHRRCARSLDLFAEHRHRRWPPLSQVVDASAAAAQRTPRAIASKVRDGKVTPNKRPELLDEFRIDNR